MLGSGRAGAEPVAEEWKEGVPGGEPGLAEPGRRDRGYGGGPAEQVPRRGPPPTQEEDGERRRRDERSGELGVGGEARGQGRERKLARVASAGEALGRQQRQES